MTGSNNEGGRVERKQQKRPNFTCEVGTEEVQNELSTAVHYEGMPPSDAKDPPEKAEAPVLASGSEQEDTLVPDDEISVRDELDIHQLTGNEIENIATKM